jgi:hypothetical protein
VTAATAQRHLLLNMTANGSLGPEGEDLLVVRRGGGPVRRRRGRQALHRRPVRAVLLPARLLLGPEFEDAAEGQLHELCCSPPRLQPLGAVGADRAPLISDRGVLGRIAEIVAGILAEASTRLWLWKGTTCTPSVR